MQSKYPILDDLLVPQSVLDNWQITVDLMAKLAKVPSALIMRVHANSIEVFKRSANPDNVYKQGETAPLDSGLYCETVMDTQARLMVKNALTDPLWDKNPDIELGMIAYCGLPLTWPTGEVFGTLCVLDKRSNDFSGLASELLERFRESIQLNLEVIFDNFRHQEDFREAEELTHVLENQYRFLVESIPAVTYKLTVEKPAKPIYISPQIEALSGYSPRELTQHPQLWQHLIHPDDIDRVQQWRDKQAHSAIDETCEYRMRNRNGDTKWVRDEAKCIANSSGDNIRIQGLIHDISEYKAAEEEIQLLQYALDHVEDSAFLIDEQANIIYANKGASKQTGYSGRELIGLSVADIDPSFPIEIWSDHWDELRSKKNLIFESRHKRKNDTVYPVEISANIIHYQDKYLNLAFARDITSRRQAEHALKESSQRYHSMIQTTKDGFWVVDLQGNIVEVNDSYCEQSGYSRRELLHMRVAALEAKETETQVQLRLQSILQQGSMVFETLHKRKDGSVWPLEVSVVYTPMEGGRVIAFMRDITERWQENELSSLQKRLSELVFNGSQDDLLQNGLDTAERLTSSEIGFFHFVEEDQETISLQTWSTRTLREMCFAEGKGMHYPVSEAGVWVDCIHQRKPVIHNDYPSLPHKKGMPKGHAKLARELTVPLIQDDKIVAVIGVGNKPRGYSEKDIEITRLIAQMTFAYVERRRAEDKVMFMAYYDPLTKLPNRALLHDRLSQAYSQSMRNRKPIAICYLDLDNFKPVNDKLGHSTGDALLKAFSDRLQTLIRNGDTLARLGGDEFVILVNGLDDIYQLDIILDRFISVSQRPFDINGHQLTVTISLGVTIYPLDDADPDTLLRHADQAMYKAKMEGKNSYRVYDAVEDKTIKAKRQLLNEFELALTDEQLVLHYQPQIDLSNGEISGVEALIRWNHPTQGLLYPDKFIPSVIDSSLNQALDNWVLENALAQCASWLDQGIALSVNINVTPAHIQSMVFYENLKQLLAKYPKRCASLLGIEILETTEIDDTTKIAEVMTACTQLGVHFSLDDFGTGYSSLTYFHKLPIDLLKIDRNFVMNMINDPNDLDIVEGILKLSQALGRPVLAEGVENTEIGLMLLQSGCQYAQGYGISRPIAAEKVASWVKDWNKGKPWHKLHNLVNKYHANDDINLALYTHQAWLNAVVERVKSATNAKKHAMETKQCEFNHWYNGVGRDRFGSNPNFGFVLPAHEQTHKLAEEMLSLIDQGEIVKAQQMLQNLEQANVQFKKALVLMAD